MDKETTDEFAKVRTEFSEYRKEFDYKLDQFMDNVMDKLHPPFSFKEIMGLIIVFLGMMGGAIAYVSSLKEMVNTTNEKTNKQDLLIKEYQIQNKEDRKEDAKKTDKILEIVSGIQIDVAVLNEKKKDYLNRKSEIETNKQVVRDFTNGITTK